MKKEASAKNKKWLWLVIALVAILAVAGVLVAVLLGGGNQDNGDATPNSKLYWNVDKAAFTQNEEALATGLTTRERDDDGLYHVRLVTGGELIEVLVDDARLINYIDTLDALGLVFDADGMVVDAIDPSVFNPEIVREFYVRSVTDTSVTVNSSIAMNGLDMTFDLTKAGVYDVSGTAAQPGMPAVCDVMDSVFVYGDMDGNATDIFIVERAQNAEVYWPIPGYYDSTTKETTRIPDENGVYTMTFAYKGELVDLKCKDKLLVNKFDKTGSTVFDRTYALLFDEEGYIIGNITTEMAVRGMLAADAYHIDSLENGTFHAVGYMGKTEGKELTTTLRDDCEVYLVCDNGTVQSHIGEKTELQLGDRVLVFTDLEGNAKLIYVLNRMVDSPLYYNLDRNYSTSKQATGRTPDENGYYNFRMLVNGKIKNYRTKDVNLATALDLPEHRGVGLKLRGDIIEKVYDIESVTCMTPPGWGRFVTGLTGNIVSAASVSNLTNPKNLVVSPECKIYDVSGDMDGVAVGSITTLQMYDQVSLFADLNGLCEIYITRRYVPDAKLYYNLKAEYDRTTKQTKRTPDADGYYVIDMAYAGKQVQVKTKNKEIASYIDAASNQLVALKVSKEGVIKSAYDCRSIVKAGALTSTSYYYDKFEENEYKCYVVSDGEKVPNGVKIKKGSKAPGIYNVSYGVERYAGEKSSLRKDDKVIFLIDRMEGNAAYAGFITSRKMDLDIAYNRTRMYNSTTGETTRTPDADGYYVFDLLIEGAVKQYKTKNKEIASMLDSYSAAFGVKLKDSIIEGVYTTRAIKGVDYAFVSHFDVTAINGNKITFTRNRPTASNYGEVRETVLAKDCKVYDLSPYAEKWGAKTKLEVGDRVIAYISDDKELCYIFISYACTREEGPVSHCDHCDKDVWWEPFVSEIFDVDEVHYYYPVNTTTSKQFVIGGLEKPVLQFKQAGVVNLYKGVTLTGDVDNSIGTLNEKGESAISEKANKMTFPDVESYVAYCPVCEKDVTWKGVSNSSRVRAANGDHQFLREDNTITSENAAIYSNPVECGFESMCLHLNGKTLKTNSNVTAMEGVLNIMGTGTVSCTCTSETFGNAALSVHRANGVMNLYGGTYVSTSRGTDVAVVLDMNGKDITVRNRVAQVYGTLDIFDTVGGGAINVVNSVAGTNGAGFVASEGGVITLHSGTLKTGESAAMAKNGGIVIANPGGTFNMLGGTITGGSATNGGNVAVSGGTFNMKGGTIAGGVAASFGGNVYITGNGTVNMTGGKLLDGSSKNGGNVAVLGGVFNMADAAVYNGQASNNGGNVYVLDAASFIMTDGEVAGGQASNTGGNFHIQASNNKYDEEGNQIRGKLEISGGTVYDGVADRGGNIFLSNNSSLTHTGGKIVGGTAITSGSSITVGSSSAKALLGAEVTDGDVYSAQTKPVITLTGKVKLDNMVLESGAIVAMDSLDSAADIKVTATGAFTEENEKAEEYKNCFTATDPAKFIQPKDDILYCDIAPTECPACHEMTNWRNISERGRISSSWGTTHWVIDPDFACAETSNPVIYSAKSGFTMCVDLKGNLSGNTAIQSMAGTLNIVGNGSFVTTSTSTSPSVGASAIYVNETGVLNLYGGTYTDQVESEPAVLLGAGTPVLNVYNGVTINGNVKVRSGLSADSQNATMNFYGGTVTGDVTVGSTAGPATVTLAGNATVGSATVAANGKVIVEDGWSGNAKLIVADYVTDAAYPGYQIVPAELVEIKGTLNGTLKNAQGIVYELTADKRLMVQMITDEAVQDYALTMDFPEDAQTYDAFCPACNKSVTWNAIKDAGRMSTSTATHWFLAGDVSYTSATKGVVYSNTGSDTEAMCIHLNGKTITTNTTIDAAAGMLNIMGSGTINTTGERNNRLFSISSTAKVNLYGGTYNYTGAEGNVLYGDSLFVVTLYSRATLNGNVYTRAGSLVMNGGTVNGKLTYGSLLTLDGNATITALTPALTGKVTIKPTWTGTVVADFPVYEKIAAEPNYGLVYSVNAVVEGTQLGGTLTNAAGKAYALTTEGRLKLETDKFAVAQADIAAVAEDMYFPTGTTKNVEAYCPACNKMATWVPNTTANDRVRIASADKAHRFLAIDIKYTTAKQTGAIYATTYGDNATACVHLNNKTITSKSEIIAESGPITLNILGNGVVKSTLDSTNSYNQAVVRSPSANGTINLYGGTYESQVAVKPAVIAKNGIVNIYGKTAFVVPENTDVMKVTGNGAINDRRVTTP